MGIQKGEGAPVFEEGQSSLSDWVDGQMFTYVGLRGPPHEGSFGGVELDQQAAVAVWRSEGGTVGHRFMKPGSDRVDFGRRGDGPEGCHTLTVFNQEGEGRQAGFDGEDRDGSRRKTIRDPSLDPSSEGVEFVLHLQEGSEEVCTIQEHRGDERGGQAVTEVGGKSFPRWRQIFDSFEGTLGKGEPPREMWISRERGGEPIAEPPDLLLGR